MREPRLPPLPIAWLASVMTGAASSGGATAMRLVASHLRPSQTQPDNAIQEEKTLSMGIVRGKEAGLIRSRFLACRSEPA